VKPLKVGHAPRQRHPQMIPEDRNASLTIR
jgi:hypothetical protein